MKFSTILFLLITGCLLTACAMQPKVAEPKKLYNNREYVGLTYCVGLSDTARAVAEKKLAGVPKEEVIKYYSGKAHAELTTAIVQTVYKDTFTSTWDYTLSFFQDCAQNVADVPRDRVKTAAYCRQNSLIADVAYAYKQEGAPREKAYGHFARFKSKAPREIIDQVYDGSKNRAESSLAAWQLCMSPISEIK